MFAHRSVNLTACVVLAAMLGCNSAHVMQKNIERTAQNWGKPKERPFPMLGNVSEAGNAARQDDRLANPTVQEDDLREDKGYLRVDEDDLREIEGGEDAIIQTGGQKPSSIGGGVISGRVLDSSGRPQPNVSVVASATRRPGSPRADVTTDSRGNFVLRGLEPGQRYLILATAIRNSSSLIGRVSSVPPEQGVVIEIAAPFTANRDSTSRVNSMRDPARQQSPAADSPSNARSGRTTLNQDPFGERSDSVNRTVTKRDMDPAVTQSPSAKRTREQAAADNRLESPWDMPAPSTRKTPPSTATKPQQVASRDGSDSSWKPAGGGRPVQLSAKPREKVLETPQPHVADADPESERITADEVVESNRDPRRPLSQPVEVFAHAKPDRPRALATKANVPLEPAETEAKNSPNESRHPQHDGPMCQFDGKRLVDFQLTDIHGQPVNFGGISSRLVLIDFWTTWCGPCLRAMPHLVSLQRRYGPQGLQVIGIACEQGAADERVARVAQIREQVAINYPLLLDEGGDQFMVRDKFGVDVYPTLILLDKSGKVLWRSEGPDQADLQQLEKLLKTQLATASTGYN
jgi:thiol-disulfide isomerase/thioredoxin